MPAGKNFYIGCGAGLAAGGLQGYLTREFVDTKYRIDALGDFGQPSVLAGLIGGGTALGLGLAGFMGKGPLRSDFATGIATTYGITALATGIYSLLFPVKKEQAAAAAAAAKPKAVAKPPVRVVRSETKAAPKAPSAPQVRISKVGAAGTAARAPSRAPSREEAQFM